MRVIVIGGGIAGLVAAIGMERQGHEVTVFEQAPAITEVGAGIQVPPNAARILEAWGLLNGLERRAVIPESMLSYNWRDGKYLGAIPVGKSTSPFGSPMYLVYRPDLIETLLDSVSSPLNLGMKLESIAQSSHEAVARFTDGTEFAADLIVGADGIKSTVRQVVLQDDEQPRYTGSVAYRALIPVERVAHLKIPDASIKWWGEHTAKNLVYYRIAGGKMLNVAAFVPAPEWGEESWTARGEVHELQKEFEDFASPVPEILAQIDTSPYRWALHDRQPIARWSSGRVVLVGDAAHPMVPFMGQGAAMAIEDAAVLTSILRETRNDSLQESLSNYGALRQARATKVQEGSRNVTISDWLNRDWLYGYNALALQDT